LCVLDRTAAEEEKVESFVVQVKSAKDLNDPLIDRIKAPIGFQDRLVHTVEPLSLTKQS
jgi:hypothetical protein